MRIFTTNGALKYLVFIALPGSRWPVRRRCQLLAAAGAAVYAGCKHARRKRFPHGKQLVLFAKTKGVTTR